MSTTDLINRASVAGVTIGGHCYPCSCGGIVSDFVTNEYTGLVGTVETATSDISSLTDAVDAITDDVSTLTSDLGDVTANVEDIDSNVGGIIARSHWPKVMFLGDSMTYALGGRAKAVTDLFAACGPVELVGPYQNYPASDTDYTTLDAHHCGNSGACITDYLVRDAPYGRWPIAQTLATYQPDVVMCQLGTNDIANGYTAEQAIANMTELVGVFEAGGVPAGSVLLSTIPPLTRYDATKDRQRIAYNVALRGLESTLGVNVYTSEIVDSDLGVDGVHPTDEGYTKLGAAWARGFTYAQLCRSADSRSIVPRDFTTHAAQSCCVIGDTIDYCQMDTSSNNALTSGSFVIAFWVYPTDIGQVFQYGAPNADGVLLLVNTNGTSLLVFNHTTTVLQQTNRFTFNAWNRVVIVADADAGTVTQYVNGTTRASATSQSWAWMPANKQWVLGWGRGAGSGTFSGTICDFTICLPSASGWRIPTRRDIWDDYYGCTPGSPVLPGISAYWPMHEGSGSSVADSFGGSSGTLSGVTWAETTMPGG